MEIDVARCGERLTDFHSHVLPAEFLAFVGNLARRVPAVESLRDRLLSLSRSVKGVSHIGRALKSDPAERHETVSAAGIDFQLLSPASFATIRGEVHDEVRVEVAQSWNDAALKYADCQPDTFGVLGAVPLTDAASACDFAEALLARDGCVGVMLPSHINGSTIASSEWYPLFELLESAKAVVLVHPIGFRAPGVMDARTEVDLGTQLEDSLVSVEFMRSRTAELPGLKLIVSHLGGGLSAIVERLDEHWLRDQGESDVSSKPSDQVRKLHFDTAGHGPMSIKMGMEMFSPQRVVLGSDYPMVATNDLALVVQRFRDCVNTKAN